MRQGAMEHAPERILIAEDNEVAATELRLSFRKCGIGDHLLDVVVTGEDALRLAQTQPYRMIVMDVCLKGHMDGFAAVAAIRSAGVAVPTFIVSAAAANVHCIAKSRQCGAIGVLPKPTSAEMLAAALENRWVGGDELDCRRVSDPCVALDVTLGEASDTIESHRLGAELHAAVWKADKLQVVSLLMKGAPIDWVDPETGNAAIHVAARMGNCELIDFLLDRGANVNTVSRKGYTALHVAAWSNHLDCVMLLLSTGCEVAKKSVSGLSVFDVAAAGICEYLTERGFAPPQPSGSPALGVARQRRLRGRSLSQPGSPKDRVSLSFRE